MKNLQPILGKLKKCFMFKTEMKRLNKNLIKYNKKSQQSLEINTTIEENNAD